MKRYALILLLLISGCGKNEFTAIFTNPQTQEVGVFYERLGAESTPVVWNGRVLIVTFHRPASGYYVTISDLETKAVVSTISTPDFTTGCAIVHNGYLYLYGTSGITLTGGNSFNNTISVIMSADLQNWTAPQIIYNAAPNTAAWNVSVTHTDNGWVMAYDYSEALSDVSPAMARFLHSDDLINWTDMPGRLYGRDRYFAAVTIRYSNGWYYAMYVQSYIAKQHYLPNVISRSPDLINWEHGVYAVMSPLGITEYRGSATDADMVEFCGKTVIVYLTGDQGGAYGTDIRIAEFPGGMDNFLSSHFTQGTP